MTEKEYNRCIDGFADSMMRFAMRCYADRETCRDAVQEAMIALWKSRKEVAESKGRAYLLGAVYRWLMAHMRHLEVEKRHSALHVAEAYVHPNEQFDLREAIDHALQHLPTQQRAILQLRDVEGYSYDEIASTLSLTTDQVQVYLFRARVALRRTLDAMGYNPNKI